MKSICTEVVNGTECVIALNLATEQTCIFDKNTTPLWAVVYGYCMDNKLESLLSSHAHDGSFIDFAISLPITWGDKTIACGDWCAKNGGFTKEDYEA